MYQFIEHTHKLSAQAAGNAIESWPLNSEGQPMTLDSVMVYLSAVAGSPTAVTIDVNITDGTVTNTPIAASSIGTAAGTTRHLPSAASKEAGTHTATIKTSAYWRFNFDLNFTAGTSPTVTGMIAFRWRV